MRCLLLYWSAAATVKALGAARSVLKALDEAIAIVVNRQTERADEGEEGDGVDVLLIPHVRAEVGRDPRAREAPESRDHGEQPERHGTDPEEIRDDVLRKAGDQIEDETEDRALGLEDEVQPVPVVLGQPRPDQRLAPLPSDPEAQERADREPDRRVDHAPEGAEEGTTDRTRDLAGDRRNDHLQGLDGDEHHRRGPAPRGHRVLEEMLVAVETDDEPDRWSVRHHEPHHDSEETCENGRGEGPLSGRVHASPPPWPRGGHSGGRRSPQGHAASYAADAARTVRSAWRRPTI